MTDEKFYEMCAYESVLATQGFRLLGGIDEAGRGPLAGPVTAACVILPAEGPFPRANDSKKLTEKAREELYCQITDMALAFGVGMVDSETIDRINILSATHLAMRQAIEACAMEPDIVMVDHLTIREYSGRQFPLTHGDALSVTIGAASIVAKVTRDRLMRQMAERYPEYGFDKHKGYGTKAHYEAIERYGLTPIHRRSFLKKYL